MNDSPLPSFGHAPSAADLDRLARAALASIPAPFADHLPHIVIQVEEFPDDELLDEMEVEDPFEITGLYQGIPVGERTQALATQPDMIFLFRQPLLAEWCETDQTLEEIITHLIVHEVGHHFGLSDDDMEYIEDSVD